LVSVIIPNFNLGANLPYTLSSVAASVYPNIEIIVCDDASTDLQTIELLGRLEQDFKNRSLRTIYARYNRGLAGARNLAIREARGKYVLTLDADDLISPDFIAKAVGALERNPAHSIVVPQTAFFSEERNEIPKKQLEYLDFFVFHGEAFACGFFENRFSTATVLARRTLFQEMTYREDLRALEDWDFYLRATIAGKRFIVTNELHFFYRRRQGSMISELHHNARHRVACFHDLRRIQRLESGSLSFPAYVFSAWEGALVADLNLAEIRRLSDELHSVRSSGAAEIQRLGDDLRIGAAEIQRLSNELDAIRNSESVRAALHLANFVNMRLPWLSGPLKSLGSKVWAFYGRLRGRR
jgi:glycosyltransferase involved in cell wall biosynthesis